MFFMESDKKIALINLFQHLLSAEILTEWKTEFILPYLVRNLQINASNKLTTKYHKLLFCWIPISFPIEARSILELKICSYSLNIGQDRLNFALTM